MQEASCRQLPQAGLMWFSLALLHCICIKNGRQFASELEEPDFVTGAFGERKQEFFYFPPTIAAFFATFKTALREIPIRNRPRHS